MILDKDFSVLRCKVDGILLALFITEYCVEKNELNNSVFSLKSATNLFSWKFKGIQERLSTYQYVLELEDGSSNLLDKRLQYLCFEPLMKTPSRI